MKSKENIQNRPKSSKIIQNRLLIILDKSEQIQTVLGDIIDFMSGRGSIKIEKD